MGSGLFDCKGKVTLVTGGNSGIGLGFARGVAQMGGDLVLWGRNRERNEAAQRELLDLGAGRVSCQQVDVTDEAAIIAGYHELLKHMGRVDCVFANSGMSAASRSLLDMSTEEYRAIMNLNLDGAFFTLREGARAMVRRAENGEPGGSLVACGSLSMFMGLAGKQSYAGSKAALGAMIRGMAVEFGKYGIRANAIAPGYVVTGMMDNPQGKMVTRMFAERTPIPREGYPADFEGIGAYLASDASRWHSGDTIVIDGAYLVRPM
ncbi:SDR family NAD(P)-dependent oxidoreductase [Novosphingobium mangrovi (ex Hu et al. 2023)]|uniref:SDR family oxidoreductase n=1 Tax=Novosphingobium mangrovi (ex Hu et al. 2023) TaxID=2930094 RepID=A0ABT0AEQ2_9SPHN|nr:SDR family oxidoreductase [Novosphingobium mangrovi (ex Hu et al. 2023)]MCJ1961662.1 SDR family oxidoreductase [Novosphingobium mangrovi (ex Hu et al. 2023)]